MGSSNRTFQRMVLRTGLIAKKTILIVKKPFILMNGSPKPVF
jgi:hypothetical protein